MGRVEEYLFVVAARATPMDRFSMGAAPAIECAHILPYYAH